MVTLVHSVEGTSSSSIGAVSSAGFCLKSGFFSFTVSVLMRKLHDCMRSLWNHLRQMTLQVAKHSCAEESSILMIVQSQSLKVCLEVCKLTKVMKVALANPCLWYLYKDILQNFLFLVHCSIPMLLYAFEAFVLNCDCMFQFQYHSVYIITVCVCLSCALACQVAVQKNPPLHQLRSLGPGKKAVDELHSLLWCPYIAICIQLGNVRVYAFQFSGDCFRVFP